MPTRSRLRSAAVPRVSVRTPGPVVAAGQVVEVALGGQRHARPGTPSASAAPRRRRGRSPARTVAARRTATGCAAPWPGPRRGTRGAPRTPPGRRRAGRTAADAVVGVRRGMTAFLGGADAFSVGGLPAPGQRSQSRRTTVVRKRLSSYESSGAKDRRHAGLADVSAGRPTLVIGAGGLGGACALSLAAQGARGSLSWTWTRRSSSAVSARREGRRRRRRSVVADLRTRRGMPGSRRGTVRGRRHTADLPARDRPQRPSTRSRARGCGVAADSHPEFVLCVLARPSRRWAMVVPAVWPRWCSCRPSRGCSPTRIMRHTRRPRAA